jgi:type I restriction enzyme S subunit
MRSESDLPQGWTIAALSECSTQVTDGTHLPPAFVDSGVPFLFVKHIVKGQLTFQDTKFISIETWQEFQRRCPIDLDDVLYTAVGSYGVAVSVNTDRPFSFQRHIAHIKPYRQIDSRYLAYFLNSTFGLTQAHQVARGVAQKTVTLGDLKQFRIVLAPLNEQRRIVARIEELFSDLDAGVAALERAKANLKGRAGPSIV